MPRLLLLLLSLCLSVAFGFVLPAPAAFLDRFAADGLTRADVRRQGAESPAESRLALVTLDEKSLAEVGPWPWPRERVAELVRLLLDRYGMQVVTLDILFPERKPGDDKLARQLAREQTVAAIAYRQDGGASPAAGWSDAVPGARGGLQVGVPVSLDALFGSPAVANQPELRAPHTGHMTPRIDDDGIVREIAPVLCHLGACHATLALATYVASSGADRIDIVAGDRAWGPRWRLRLQAGGAPLLELPLTADGTLRIPYRHSRDRWTAVSAADVLAGRADPALLKGAMALIGGTALGLWDTAATPLSNVSAGLELHAELLSGLLDADTAFRTEPALQWPAQAAWLALLGGLLWAGLQWSRTPAQRAVLWPVWLLLSWGASAGLWAWLAGRHLLQFSAAPAMVFPLLTLLLLIGFELHRAARERLGVVSVLKAYLPDRVAQRLADRGDAGSEVEAQRRVITVMFADIKGFTTLCEGRPPELIARLLHRVFSEMAEAVLQHHGTIDKYIGDAILAFWNAPDEQPHHARAAVAAALEIHHRMSALDGFCAELGLPPLVLGIGVETGPALVGSFGGLARRTYTALGDTVVIASRLEGLSKAMQQPVLLGPECAAALEPAQVVELATMPIRGRSEPLRVFGLRTGPA